VKSLLKLIIKNIIEIDIFDGLTCGFYILSLFDFIAIGIKNVKQNNFE